MARPETGPMQFGEDWPGVFIRGDEAFGYAQMLQMVLETPEGTEIPRMVLKSLLDLLHSSIVEGGKTPEGTQVLKPWTECQAKQEEHP